MDTPTNTTSNEYDTGNRESSLQAEASTFESVHKEAITSNELSSLLRTCSELIESLSDSTRFSYAGVFATTLSLLFFSSDERYVTFF